MKNKKNCQGFTLVELLVVILIIGILAGTGIGLSGYARRRAAESRAVAELHMLKDALEEYKIQKGFYPDTLDATVIDELIAFQGSISEIDYETDRNSKQGLIDPWGVSYIYKFDYDKNPEVFYILSAGQDGKTGSGYDGDNVTATGTM